MIITRMHFILPWVVLLTAPSCAQILGFDDVTAASDAGAQIADAAPDAMVDPLACAEEEITPALGISMGNTEATSNERDLSCGSVDSNDLLLGWRAPVTDYFVFTTMGSTFDTVLALFDGCQGDELFCNNNVGEASESELVVKLEQASEVLIAIDGFAGDTGDVTLNVERVSCPDSDLEGQPLPVDLTTSGFGDDFFNSCGGNLEEDRAYHYVAPADGLYAFTAIAEGYRAIVSVMDGARCQDAELGCNAAAEPEYTSEVVRRLTEGQSVSVYVDGVDGSGAFNLDIQPVAATCPSGVLSEDDMLVSDYEARTMSSSCSSIELRNGVNLKQELNDKTFLVNIPKLPLGCFGSCEITVSSNGAFSAAILAGADCGGAEEQCEQAGPGNTILQVPMDEAAATTRTLIVTDRDPGESSGFTVAMGCFVACA